MNHFEKLASIHAGYKLDKVASIVAAKTPSEATIYLYDAIGTALGGITPTQVVEALAEVRGAKTLHVRINSPGGSVFDAMAVHQALKEFPARKVVHVDGLAASAASFIAMVGDEIISSPGAMWFVHGAQGVTMGSAQDHRASADLLDQASTSIASIYAQRTGQAVADVRALMEAETFLTAAEAKALGFTTIDGEGQQPTAAVRKVVALSQDTQLRVASAQVAARRITRGAASGNASPGLPGTTP